MIAIIDYGAGNIGSISNMLKRLGTKSMVTSRPEEIAAADKLILPGVGSFDYGISSLRNSGLIASLTNKVVIEKTPILGICLGAQLMTQRSEEGELPGLGWFDAKVSKFSFAPESNLRVPHMGWNFINVEQENQLSVNLPAKSRFYFVHSYFLSANNESDVMMTTRYGREFASGLARENIYAVQFHPEKSHKFGLQLFKNFLAI